MTNLKNVSEPNNHDVILLGEIGALIHDLGKLSEEFIIQQSKECFNDRTCCLECDFDHENILNITGFFDPVFIITLKDRKWNRLLKSNTVTKLKQAPMHLGHFIPGHANLRSGIGLLALVTRCDQVDSGVDKGALQSSAKQSRSATYMASAFGYEQEDKRIDLWNYFLKVKRSELVADLHDPLKRLLEGKSKPAQERTIIMNATKNVFRQALGETRRAANDVTLWDHAYSVACLQKAALAQFLLEGSWPSDLLQLKWRILRITINGFQFLESAYRIPDLLGKLQAFRNALNNVRTLVEITIPLGNEIYRDENGSAFIVPNVENLLDLTDEHGDSLRDLIVNEFVHELCGEIQLDLSPGWISNPSRYGIELGRLLNTPPPPLTSDLEEIRSRWDDKGQSEVCAVCNLRPQGPSKKAEDRHVCNVCERRRADRSRDWVTKKLKTTIWTDEVADQNGQLALIVGRFNLTTWLDGHSLSSILAQEFPKGKTYEEVVEQLAEELRNNVIPDRSSPPLLQQLAPEAFRQPFRQTAQEFYKYVVEERDIHILCTGIEESDYRLKAELVLLFLLRKNPSFARLRRIWDTAREFWQEVCPTDEERDLDRSLVGRYVGRAGPRLQITGTLRPRQEGDTIGPYHAYDLDLSKGNKMSVVLDPANEQRFITCDNLDYLALKCQQNQPFLNVLHKGNTLTIEEPVGYGAKNKVWGTVVLDSDAVEIPDSQLIPTISILAEPQTFMALVPADKALEVVEAIQAKYEREMGKVRNRLPLHLGLVYAHRRTPLRAILDAGRRMLDQSAGPEGWKVMYAAPKSIEKVDELPKRLKDDESGQFHEWYEILLKKGGQRLTWCVPVVMGDGTTPDLWYPYVFLNTLSEPSDRDRRFQAPNPWTGSDGWLVHVADLKTGDSIYFTPATLDFQWLDSAGRRFEIAYDAQGQRRGLHRRPYLLDELEDLERIWKTLKNHLSKNQIYAIRDLIEAKRAEWQEMNPVLAELDPQGEIIKRPEDVFWQFCYNALANAEWCDGEKPWQVEKKDRDKWLAQWANYLAKGWFTDVVELHLQIMKEEVQI
jgi:CRISPR-associated Csx11 family protein